MVLWRLTSETITNNQERVANRTQSLEAFFEGLNLVFSRSKTFFHRWSIFVIHIVGRTLFRISHYGNLFLAIPVGQMLASCSQGYSQRGNGYAASLLP
ncbi:MAG: hypothetical protein DME22_05060 [Verrucomicrobia bacterium]|nr:MAG: hypothetical protein DME22_05060 [Verrucomicrobiota bacterium]PYJ95881.1 MAG: hypothetical protein DME23_22495 [Verrucomicrobiota bacterium]